MTLPLEVITCPPLEMGMLVGVDTVSGRTPAEEVPAGIGTDALLTMPGWIGASDAGRTLAVEPSGTPPAGCPSVGPPFPTVGNPSAVDPGAMVIVGAWTDSG